MARYGLRFASREKTLLYAAAAVVAVSVFSNALLLPLARANGRLSSEIAASERTLKAYRGLIKDKEALRTRFDAAFAGIPTVSSSRDNSLVTVLAEIERFAVDAQVQIRDIRPQGFQGTSALYKEANIEVRASGPLPAFMKFIYGIEHSLTLLRIRKFQLNTRPNTVSLDGTFFLSVIATSG